MSSKINYMKTILLLGGYGFIGTNILKYIDENVPEKYQVVVFDRYPKHMDNIQFRCITKNYAGDFSDEYLMNKVFSENRIDIVLHSLSASVPSLSIDNAFDLRYNVIPTITLLNIMSKHNVNHIAFLSSGGEIYGDHYVDSNGHSEEEVLLPKSAYGVSKMVIEKYLYLYNLHYGIKSLILRLSNPYGPFHYSKKQGIINIALESALQGKEFHIWGDGNGRKDYIYIEDFCKILFYLFELPWEDYRVINVGSGELLSVNQITNCIKDICPNFNWNYQDSNVLDVQEFKLNLEKINNIVNIRYTPIEEGLLLTKKWYEDRNNSHI